MSGEDILKEYLPQIVEALGSIVHQLNEIRMELASMNESGTTEEDY
jgi:hypothetical protein